MAVVLASRSVHCIIVFILLVGSCLPPIVFSNLFNQTNPIYIYLCSLMLFCTSQKPGRRQTQRRPCKKSQDVKPPVSGVLAEANSRRGRTHALTNREFMHEIDAFWLNSGVNGQVELSRVGVAVCTKVRRRENRSNTQRSRGSGATRSAEFERSPRGRGELRVVLRENSPVISDRVRH